MRGTIITTSRDGAARGSLHIDTMPRETYAHEREQYYHPIGVYC